MKRLILNGHQQEAFEAERIVVDRVNGTIIGYNGKQEVFALRGVDFSKINYEVEGGADAPDPSSQERIAQLEQLVADLSELLLENGVI